MVSVTPEFRLSRLSCVFGLEEKEVPRCNEELGHGSSH